MTVDPFVQHEYQTFTYPEPLTEPDNQGNSREPMVNPEVAELPQDERPWIKLRVPRSRADVDAVADYSQSIAIFGDNGDGAKFEQRIAKGNRGVFELLVQEWSFDAPPSGANYSRLNVWAGDWVVACLAKVGEIGTRRDYAKKTGSSSAKRSGSRSSSPSGDA